MKPEQTHNVYDELKWRDALADATPSARQRLEDEQVTFYVGFDPSAPSLHIGNLVPIMGMLRMQRAGHKPIAVVGGGTGMIGDPSGRTTERTLLDEQTLKYNSEQISKQLTDLLGRSTDNPVRIVDNASWLKDLTLIQFLRDVGKRFTVNTMMSRESVRARYEREAGISYTEFSYQLIQAYDFLHLNEKYNCTFQLGGSDQWGNILSGIELIRKVKGVACDCIVYPLVTSASGTKFGKSLGDAPTLDPNKTSPYKLYQFFLNVADEDVIRYLKLFTFIDRTQIDGMEQSVENEPHKRDAQKLLSAEITRMVHNDDGLKQALKVTNALFSGDLRELTARQIEELFEGAPAGNIARTRLDARDLTITTLAVEQGVCASLGEARRVIAQGGLYINEKRVEDEKRIVTTEDLISEGIILLRKGKKSYHIVKSD